MYIYIYIYTYISIHTYIYIYIYIYAFMYIFILWIGRWRHERPALFLLQLSGWRQMAALTWWAKDTATYCNTLQHTATHGKENTVSLCVTRQHTATHCITHQRWEATQCNTLQHTARHCNTLQHVARHCDKSPCKVTGCIYFWWRVAVTRQHVTSNPNVYIRWLYSP